MNSLENGRQTQDVREDVNSIQPQSHQARSVPRGSCYMKQHLTRDTNDLISIRLVENSKEVKNNLPWETNRHMLLTDS